MEQHKCINKEIIEQLRSEIQILKTKSEIHENNINTTKEDVKDIKGTVKQISEKMDTGFKSIDKWLIGLLVTALFSFGGIAVTIILFLASNKK